MAAAFSIFVTLDRNRAPLALHQTRLNAINARYIKAKYGTNRVSQVRKFRKGLMTKGRGEGQHKGELRSAETLNAAI